MILPVLQDDKDEGYFEYRALSTLQVGHVLIISRIYKFSGFNLLSSAINTRKVTKVW